MSHLTKNHFVQIKLYACLVVMIFSALVPLKVFAYDEGFFSANDILFYEPCGGTAADNSASGAPNGIIVAIGDSLLLRDKSKLEDKLKTNKYTDITIDAQSSRSIYRPGVGDNGKPPSNALDAIQDNKAKLATAGTIVFVLGTNQDNFEDGIPELMKSLRKINEDSRVYWVNTANTNANAIDGANKINDAIKKYSTKTNKYAVIDWNKAVFGGGSTDSNGLLDSSGYHQSPAGIVKHVNLIADAVGEPPDESGGLTGKNNKEKIWCYFMGKGLSKQSTAGIMGNLQTESHFSPCLEQTTFHCHKQMVIDGHTGYGIAQFTSLNLQQKLHTMMKTRGYPDRDDILLVQLDFIYKLLSTDSFYADGWSVLKPGKTPSVYNATKAFMLSYERPSDQSETAIQGRTELSNARLAELGNKTCGPSTNGTPNNTGSEAVPATNTNTTSNNKTVVVLDPGHAPAKASNPRLDPENLLDINGSWGPEMADDYAVAQKTKTILTEGGYEVIITKNSLNDDPTQYERAKIANDKNANIALSIHYDSARGHFGEWAEIYPQIVNGYRTKGENGSNSGRVTFDNAEVAAKSSEYSNKMKTARKNNGEQSVVVKNNSFNGRGADVAEGDLAIVQLLSEVPWVFNESGGPLNTNEQNKYAAGLAEGVKKSIGPNEGSGSSGTTTDSCGNGNTGSNPQGVAAIVEIAKKELADPGGAMKYLGFDDQWCAGFASWVYKEAGYPLTKGGGGPIRGTVTDLIDYFSAHELHFKFGQQDPQPGDMIYYAHIANPNNSDGTQMAHVAIVIEYDKASNTLTTIGGNESSTVSKKTGKLGNGPNGEENYFSQIGYFIEGFGRIK